MALYDESIQRIIRNLGNEGGSENVPSWVSCPMTNDESKALQLAGLIEESHDSRYGWYRRLTDKGWLAYRRMQAESTPLIGIEIILHGKGL